MKSPCLPFIFFLAAFNIGRIQSIQPKFKLQLTRVDPRVDAFSNNESEKAKYESDEQHFVHTYRIGIGTPPQYVNVLFSTKHHQSLIFSERFATCDLEYEYMRKTHRFYDNTKSLSFGLHDRKGGAFFKDESKQWTFGYKAQDLATVYGPRKELIQESFIEVTKASKEYTNLKADGIIALRHTNSTHIIQTLINRLCGGVETKFSFYFPRNVAGRPEDPSGELLLCGEDTTRYLPGKMRYINDISYGLWEFQISSVTLTGVDNEGRGAQLSHTVNAIFDSSSDRIVGPVNAITTLYFLIFATKIPNTDNRYQVDCNKTNLYTPVEFSIQGDSYILNSSDYIRRLTLPDKKEYCEVLIVPADAKIDYWSLGVPFLRSVFVVFDIENRRIGFGQLSSN